MKLSIYFLFGCMAFGFAQQSYYDDVDLTKTGLELFEELSDKVTETHTNFLEYTPGVWEASKATDQNPDNPAEVLLLYGYEDGTDDDITNDRARGIDNNGGDDGEWNREHTYPRSLGVPNLGTEGPGADAHHLRPSDVERNSDRSNRAFAAGSGNSGITADGYWYPGDEWKGDVARMMLFMYLRYGDVCLPSRVAIGDANDVDANMVDLLLTWNVEDPVSVFEDNRNTYHESDATYAQGNRNPFIDNPYLATLIWGGTPAEDRWDIAVEDTEAPSIPTGLMVSNETFSTIDLSWTASTDNIGILKYDIYGNGELIGSTGNTSITLTGLEPLTTYDITIIAQDVSGNRSEESEAVEGTTTESPIFLIVEDFEDCNTVSENFVIYNEASDMDWECLDQFGQDNSGAYQINGFREDEPSRDWLITKSSFDFDNFNEEELSFYLDYRFGSTPLEFLYSTDYTDGSNPAEATWVNVDEIVIPTDYSDSEEKEIFFDEVDISAITGTVYFAFRYYSNGEPTRWTLDNFTLSASNTLSSQDNKLSTIVMYPNPTADTLFLSNQNKEIEKVQIFDLSGKLIYNTIHNTTETIKVSGLPKGLFIVQVESNQGKQAFRLVVK